MQQSTIQQAKSVPLANFASNGTCPFCGHGRQDCFHINTKQNKWFCRHCTPRGGDVIDFIQRKHDMSFQSAVAELTGGEYEASSFSSEASPEPAPAKPLGRRDSYVVKLNKGRLNDVDDASGQPGRDYLRSRGVFPEKIQEHCVGTYRDSVSFPWYGLENKTALWGVRRRLMAPKPGQEKYYTGKGHSLAGQLFGSKGLRGYDNLIICEGEINMLTLYQLATDFDTLSFGSEGHKLSGPIAEWVNARYDSTLVWCDKEQIARDKVGQLGGTAIPVWNDEDANELCRFWPHASFSDIANIGRGAQ